MISLFLLTRIHIMYRVEGVSMSDVEFTRAMSQRNHFVDFKKCLCDL